MPYEVEYALDAIKGLKAASAADRRRIENKVAVYASNPIGSHQWAKPLTGSPYTRIRQGNWRAILSLDTKGQRVIVLVVERRDKVYR